MDVYLYEFEKRNNSTKIPTGEAWAHLECQLKAATDILNPVLLLKTQTPSLDPICNYAYIPAFERFYFINNWRWVNGVWEIECAVDALASWRTELGTKQEYILRTNSTDTTVFNGLISDSVYPTTCQFEKSEIEINSPFVSQITNGIYIVGCITGAYTNMQTDTSVGAVTYYAMTPYWLEIMKSKLLSDSNLETMGIIDAVGTLLVDDVSKEVLKAMYNPYQYIVSCMWFPFSETYITDKTYKTSIQIGWWEYNIPAYLIKAQVIDSFHEDITNIPWHPQAQYRGHYLNWEPFTKTTLIGRFGVVPLDMHYFYGDDTIRLQYEIDLIEGTALMKVIARLTGQTITQRLITTRLFQIGVPIQLAQITQDTMGQAMTAINSTSDIISGTISGGNQGAAAGPVGALAGASIGGFTSLMNGIYNTYAASIPQMATSGANGSFILPFQKTTLLQLFYMLVQEDIEHKGRPVYAIKQLNTLSGFILCAEGDVDIAATEIEKQMIANYLTTGFYWE